MKKYKKVIINVEGGELEVDKNMRVVQDFAGLPLHPPDGSIDPEGTVKATEKNIIIPRKYRVPFLASSAPERKVIASEVVNNQIIDKAADGGPIPFDDWYKTNEGWLKKNDKADTTSYNLRRAYELAPKEQLDAFVTDPKAHLMSAYRNPITNEYEFMKRKDHESLQLELDWYNSPDAVTFRDQYALDTSGDYYKYVPRMIPQVQKDNTAVKKYATGGGVGDPRTPLPTTDVNKVKAYQDSLRLYKTSDFNEKTEKKEGDNPILNKFIPFSLMTPLHDRSSDITDFFEVGDYGMLSNARPIIYNTGEVIATDNFIGDIKGRITNKNEAANIINASIYPIGFNKYSYPKIKNFNQYSFVYKQPVQPYYLEKWKPTKIPTITPTITTEDSVIEKRYEHRPKFDKSQSQIKQYGANNYGVLDAQGTLRYQGSLKEAQKYLEDNTVGTKYNQGIKYKEGGTVGDPTVQQLREQYKNVPGMPKDVSDAQILEYYNKYKEKDKVQSTLDFRQFNAAKNTNKTEYPYKYSTLSGEDAEKERLISNYKITKEQAEELIKSRDFLNQYYLKGNTKQDTLDAINESGIRPFRRWIDIYDANYNKPEYMSGLEPYGDQRFFIAVQDSMKKAQGTNGISIPSKQKELNDYISKRYLYAMNSKGNIKYGPPIKEEDGITMGYYDPKDNSMYLSNDKSGDNYTPIHELNHKAGWSKEDYKIDVNKINENGGVNFMTQKRFNYLSQPTELDSRKMSLLYWMYKNNKPYTNFTKERLDSIYNLEKKPEDVKDLLKISQFQQDSLLNYLNKYTRPDLIRHKLNKDWGGTRMYKAGGTVTDPTAVELRKQYSNVPGLNLANISDEAILAFYRANNAQTVPSTTTTPKYQWKRSGSVIGQNAGTIQPNTETPLTNDAIQRAMYVNAQTGKYEGSPADIAEQQAWSKRGWTLKDASGRYSKPPQSGAIEEDYTLDMIGYPFMKVPMIFKGANLLSKAGNIAVDLINPFGGKTQSGLQIADAAVDMVRNNLSKGSTVAKGIEDIGDINKNISSELFNIKSFDEIFKYPEAEVEKITGFNHDMWKQIEASVGKEKAYDRLTNKLWKHNQGDIVKAPTVEPTVQQAQIINNARERQYKWLNSEEWKRRRMIGANETENQAKVARNISIKSLNDANIELKQMPETSSLGGMQFIDQDNTPKILLNSNYNKLLSQSANHEFIHASNSRGRDYLFKGFEPPKYDEPTNAISSGVINYLKKPPESQVRGVRALNFLEDNGKWTGGEITDEHIAFLKNNTYFGGKLDSDVTNMVTNTSADELKKYLNKVYTILPAAITTGIGINESTKKYKTGGIVTDNTTNKKYKFKK